MILAFLTSVTVSQPRPEIMNEPRRQTDRFALLLAFACLLLLAWTVPAAVSAQDSGKGSGSGEESPSGDLFIDTVDVNIVNVDVYVTDEDGNPVTGLTADDFEVNENGRQVPVTNFYAVEGTKVIRERGGEAPQAEPVAEPLPPGVEPEAPALPDDQRLSLIIYIDNYNIRPHNRRRILQDVRAFVRQNVTGQDRVMLVTYDRSLHVRRSFTNNSQAVVDSLFEIEELSGHALHFDSDRRDVLERIEDAESGGVALMWAETYAESIKSDLFFSIDAIRELVSSLAGLPGRKAVLYVSDGVPMIPAEDIFFAIQQKYTGSGAMTRVTQFDASRRFEELAAHANANRVSFYTIDAAGLRVSSATDVSNFGRGQAGSLNYLDSVRTQNLQAPLQMLAEETGGRAIINSNRVGPQLERVAQDFRHYYSLGYSPGHSGDGRYYKIEVKLKEQAARKKYTVRHRTGYRDKTSVSEMNEGVLAALNFPYYSNPLDLQLSFDRGRPRDDGLFLVPVKVRVPLGRLTLVPRGEVFETQAKLYLAALDERGGVSDVQSIGLPIQVPQEEIGQVAEKSFVYTVTLLMRKGSQKVAVGVRDEIAGSNSFVTGTVYVN